MRIGSSQEIRSINQFCAWSLKNDACGPRLDVTKNTSVIARTPIGDAVVIKTPTGFEIWDISSDQRFPCAKDFFTELSIYSDLISAKHHLLLPDKRTLLWVDRLGSVYLSDLLVKPPSHNPSIFYLDAALDGIYPMLLTPNRKYLVMLGRDVSQGLRVRSLDNKTLYQRLLPPDGAEKHPFQGFAVGHDSRSVAVIYEAKKIWQKKSTRFCLQWKIDTHESQKATQITLYGIEENERIKKMMYTRNNRYFVGLCHLDTENAGVKINVWNTKNGQCVYQQFFPNLHFYDADLCVTSFGEIILIDAKKNSLKKLKFPHVPADAGIFEKTLPKRSQKTPENKGLTSEWRDILLFMSLTVSLSSIVLTASGIASPLAALLSLVHVTLALQGAALIVTTGVAFFGLGLFVGITLVLLATLIDHHCCADPVDHKMNDPKLTQPAENNAATYCDPIAAIGAYFGTFFKAKPEVIVEQIKPAVQNQMSVTKEYE